MEVYKLYKHEYNQDVAIMPIHILNDDQNKVYLIRVRWYNIVNKPFDMDLKEYITIKHSDLDKWKLYE